jgi:hypothetical protein
MMAVSRPPLPAVAGAMGAYMSDLFINTPEHWRERARQTQELADRIDDSDLKQAMLRVVYDYETLAIRVEARSRVTGA